MGVDLPVVTEHDADLCTLLSALYDRRFTGGIWLHFQSGIPKVVEMQTVQIRLTVDNRSDFVQAVKDLLAPTNACEARAAGFGASFSTTNSSATISGSSRSGIEVRRTVTAGRTVRRKRLHVGRGNTSSPTTMGTSGFRTPVSSTKTGTAARGMRTSRLSPPITVAPTPAVPSSQDSPAMSWSEGWSGDEAVAAGGPHIRGSWRS